MGTKLPNIEIPKIIGYTLTITKGILIIEKVGS